MISRKYCSQVLDSESRAKPGDAREMTRELKHVMALTKPIQVLSFWNTSTCPLAWAGSRHHAGACSFFLRVCMLARGQLDKSAESFAGQSVCRQYIQYTGRPWPRPTNCKATKLLACVWCSSTSKSHEKISAWCFKHFQIAWRRDGVP